MYDPDGIECGSTAVEVPGQYSLWAFGDYLDTLDEDEGAEAGDMLDFTVEDVSAGRTYECAEIVAETDDDPPYPALWDDEEDEIIVNIQAGEPDYDADVTRMVISLDSRRAGRDRINIQRAMLPADFGGFDHLNDEVMVSVGGYPFYIEAGSDWAVQTGRFKYRSPRGERPQIRMRIDEVRGTWTFCASRTNFPGLDHADGWVDVALMIGDSVLAESYEVDEKWAWRYSLLRDGQGTAILTEIPAFNIKTAHLRYDNVRAGADGVKINGMVGDAGFDPQNEDFVLWLDSSPVLYIPASSNWIVRRGKSTFRNRGGPVITVQLDAGRGRWSVKLSRISFDDLAGNVNPSDGVLITLEIGGSGASMFLRGSEKTILRYRER